MDWIIYRQPWYCFFCMFIFSGVGEGTYVSGILHKCLKDTNSTGWDIQWKSPGHRRFSQFTGINIQLAEIRDPTDLRSIPQSLPNPSKREKTCCVSSILYFAQTTLIFGLMWSASQRFKTKVGLSHVKYFQHFYFLL